MSPTHIVLAISLAANAVWFYAYLGQRDTATVAKTEKQQTVAVATKCSEGTEQLAAKAEQRRQQAAPKVQAARQKAVEHEKRALQILATPPAVPGNACASAQAELDSWWAERAKP